jgi:hypothetical protein
VFIPNSHRITVWQRASWWQRLNKPAAYTLAFTCQCCGIILLYLCRTYDRVLEYGKCSRSLLNLELNAWAEVVSRGYTFYELFLEHYAHIKHNCSPSCYELSACGCQHPLILKVSKATPALKPRSKILRRYMASINYCQVCYQPSFLQCTRQAYLHTCVHIPQD